MITHGEALQGNPGAFLPQMPRQLIKEFHGFFRILQNQILQAFPGQGTGFFPPGKGRARKDDSPFGIQLTQPSHANGADFIAEFDRQTGDVPQGCVEITS